MEPNKFVPPDRRKRNIPPPHGKPMRAEDLILDVQRSAQRIKFWVSLALVFLIGMLAGMAIKAGHADEKWNTTDKVLFGTYIATTAIDAKQTIDCLKLPNCEEANPLFGSKHPSAGRIVGQKALVAGLLWWAADAWPSQRRLLLIVGNVVEISVVAHNASIGLKVGF